MYVLYHSNSICFNGAIGKKVLYLKLGRLPSESKDFTLYVQDMLISEVFCVIYILSLLYLIFAFHLRLGEYPYMYLFIFFQYKNTVYFCGESLSNLM